MILLTADQMRRADQRTINEIGLPGIVLMENAARGATRVILDEIGDVEGLLAAAFCGRGNNGGDGFAVLRMLAQLGAVCTAYVFAPKDDITGDAATNLRVAEACGVEIVEVEGDEDFDDLEAEMASYDLYIDALLGTGLNSEVRGRFARAIELMNELAAPLLAIDIPSGLSADTGRPLGIAVQADWTATFGAAKQGLLLDYEDHCGEISVIDISIPPQVLEELDVGCLLLDAEAVAAMLPPRLPWGHKGSYGHLLVVGGSTGYSGAPCMTAMAGLRSGAGLVTAALPAGLNQVAEIKLTACMTQPLAETKSGALDVSALDTVRQLMLSRQALALGPGMGLAEETVELVQGLCETIDTPLVVDADGLNAIAGTDTRFASDQVVLTPHPGEAARLLDVTTADIQKDRLAAARAIAGKYNCVCLLKGARSVITGPDGLAWINATGGPLLSSGGSGDVLTGLVGGLLAQGAGALEAALCAAFVHGLAAQLAEEEFGVRGLAAEELNDAIPAAFATLETDAEEDEHVHE